MIRLSIDLGAALSTGQATFRAEGNATEDEMARFARALVNLKRGAASAPGVLRQRIILEVTGPDVTVREEGDVVLREERGIVVEGKPGLRAALAKIIDEVIYGR